MAEYRTTTDESEVTIGDSDLNSNKTYNSIIQKLLHNDLYVYGSFGEIPGVWFCSWYNDDRISGYAKGDFFWLNTEDLGKWMKDNSETIQEYANRNPYVSIKLENWRSNDEVIFEQYHNALTGYLDFRMASPLSAIYEIGELSNRFQLIVSQKDNNKDAVDVLSSWKRFVVNTDDDYGDILSKVDAQILSCLAQHMVDYHFGNDVLTYDISVGLRNYMNEDFSNAEYAYPQNFIANDGDTEGLDTVEVFIRKPLRPRATPGAIQEYVWFRKWKSGFLEHGGLVDVTLSDYVVSGNYVQIPFDWTILDKDTGAYQIAYLGDRKGDSIEVDESGENPPGDNLVSVLYELSALEVDGSKNAPVYANTSYVATITPVQPLYPSSVRGTVSSLANVPPYEGLGSNAKNLNTLGYAIDYQTLNRKYFRFRYNSKNTPEFYSYYVAGFLRGENKELR